MVYLPYQRGKISNLPPLSSLCLPNPYLLWVLEGHIQHWGWAGTGAVYMKNFLRHWTLCPTFKESMSDILLHFPDILDAISLNFRCFHRTLCPTF